MKNYDPYKMTNSEFIKELCFDKIKGAPKLEHHLFPFVMEFWKSRIRAQVYIEKSAALKYRVWNIIYFLFQTESLT